MEVREEGGGRGEGGGEGEVEVREGGGVVNEGR